jgi:hypothetical protein
MPRHAVMHAGVALVLGVLAACGPPRRYAYGRGAEVSSSGARVAPRPPPMPERDALERGRLGPRLLGGDAGAWTAHRPTNAGFACELPGQPRTTLDQQTADDGARVTVLHGTLPGPAATFGYIVVHLEGGVVGDPSELLREVERDDQANLRQAELRDTRILRAGGHFGREDRLDVGSGAVARLRHYVGRWRIYRFWVVYDRRREAQVQPAVERYFGSLRIDPADMVTVLGDGVLDTEGWRFLTPPEGLFVVDMPGAAEHRDGTIRVGDDAYPAHSFRVRSGAGRSFDVRYVTVDGPMVRGALEAAAARMAGRDGVRTVSREPITRQGFSGLRLVLQSTDATLYADLYQTAGRLYQVRVEEPGAPSAEGAGERRRFFDSFRIL